MSYNSSGGFAGRFSCLLVRVIKAKWTSSVLSSLVNGKASNHLIKKNKTHRVLGHHKLRESQDVRSNGIWLPFTEQPQLKQKEHS